MQRSKIRHPSGKDSFLRLPEAEEKSACNSSTSNNIETVTEKTAGRAAAAATAAAAAGQVSRLGAVYKK